MIYKEVRYFAKEWNINLEITCPEHKRSNNLVEHYVQEAKRFKAICAADGCEIYSASLNNRNTPKGILDFLYNVL